MKYITIFLMLLGLGGTGFAQQFDRGNNNAYTPFTNFAAPVARPTPLESPPLPGKISNLEKGIATKTVQGAHSGLHFPKGPPGVKTFRYDLSVTARRAHYSGKNKQEDQR